MITVDNVYKKYLKSRRLALRYGLLDSYYSMFNLDRKKELRAGEFWAVNGVSFELKRGEKLGLIGQNGSGKSTLLRLIAGISNPDSGSVRCKGTIGTILEVTSGFHDSLTGLENIQFRASLAGLTGAQIQKEVDRVIEFSELSDFINSPVSHYSSGMKARLGFAISTIGKPDIVLIDEALAVGDLNFRIKCYDYLNSYFKNSAVVIVSHSLSALSRFCNLGAIMSGGNMISFGDMDSAIDKYQELNAATRTETSALLDKNIQLKVFINDEPVENNNIMESGGRIRFEVSLKDIPAGSGISINMCDSSYNHIIEWNSYKSGVSVDGNQNHFYVCDTGALELKPGYYGFNVHVLSEKTELLVYTKWQFVRVKGKYSGIAPIQPSLGWNVLERV